MPKFLIIYGSVDGQTLKIAEHIAEIVRTRTDFQVDGFNAADLPADFSISGYQRILIGSSLRNRKYHPAVIKFIREYRDDLQQLPSDFYSVSLGDATCMRRGVSKILKKLFEETAWQPRAVGRFAGALLYTKYDHWTKTFMGLAGWIMRYPTDTSRDHELTNWEDVDKFADEILKGLSSQAPEPQA